MGQTAGGINKDFFFDLPIDLFCVIHPGTHHILEANPAFETILGWKPDEIIGQSLDDFTNTELDKSNIEKAFSKINLGLGSLHFETEFRGKNNMFRFIDWKCHLDDEKNIFAIGRDITSLKETQKTLQQQSTLDPVTGIANRHSFLSLLENELAGGSQFHFPTSLIMMDIDHFRSYNERYGIQKSDDCLRQVATALRTCLRRKTDFLARFENDTFVVLLSHNDLAKAVKSAEYLRSSLEKLTVRHDAYKIYNTITLSFGVAGVSDKTEHPVTPQTIINATIRALKTSQQRGGNQVSFIEAIA